MGVLLIVLGLEWSPPWSQARKIAPLDPAEVGQDQSRVLGGDTGPPVPHISHLFDVQADKEQARERTTMHLTFCKDRKEEIEKKDCGRRIVKESW